MSDQIELSRLVRVMRRAPVGADLPALVQAGIRAVIDIRSFDQPQGEGELSPAAEAISLRQRGITYLRVPVDHGPVEHASLARVQHALKEAEKPVLMHGGLDSRAGLIALAHTAVEAGLPGEHMAEMARSLDLPFASDEQREMLVGYVDAERARSDPFSRREKAAGQSTVSEPLLPEDVRTLRNEIQEDHTREFVLDKGIHPARSHPVGPSTRTVVAGAGPTVVVRAPAPLGPLAAVLALALIALDRRLMVPVLIIAGACAGRAIARTSVPVPSNLPAERRIDREIGELEARVRHLAEIA